MTQIITDTNLYQKMSYPVGHNLRTNSIIIDHYISIIKKEMKRNNWSPYEMCLICRGSSGAIIAGIIGYQLGLKVYHIKKPNEKSHWISTPSIKEEISIVVDDYISSGETIDAICEPYTKFHMLILTGSIWEGLPFIKKFQKIYVGKYSEQNRES